MGKHSTLLRSDYIGSPRLIEVAFLQARYGEMMQEQQAETDSGRKTPEEFGAMSAAGSGFAPVLGKGSDRDSEVLRDLDHAYIG